MRMNGNSFLPRVSIVIPVYNGANFLKEAIESALNQTYSNLEIIVVNDGSDDNGQTDRIARSYGDRIRYIKKENGGVSSALNCGIYAMSGDYFSWLSHDDKYEPDKVANSVAALARYDNREKKIALCGGYYINERSEKIRDMVFRLEKGRIYSGDEVMRHILTYGVLDACCLLIPKVAFETCGYFNEDLRYNQDALMWYQIFDQGYELVVDQDNRDVMYRLHAAQTSKTRRDLLVRDSYEMSKIIAPVFARYSTGRDNLLRIYAKRNARLDCVDAVKECIRVGRKAKVLKTADVVYIKVWILGGKLRNIVKARYHRMRFKK